MKHPQFIYSCILASACFLPSTTVLAEEPITKDKVLSMVKSEAEYVKNKDIDGLLSLIADDAKIIGPDGNAINKSEYKLLILRNFYATDAILETPTVIEITILDGGMAANIVVDLETKYLINRGGQKNVITQKSRQRSKIEIRDGKLQYVFGIESKI